MAGQGLRGATNGGGNPAQTPSHSPLGAEKGLHLDYALGSRPEN